MPLISDTLLDQYDYASDPVLKKHLHAWDRVYIGAMMSYASGIGTFGRQMMAHQNRAAHGLINCPGSAARRRAASLWRKTRSLAAARERNGYLLRHKDSVFADSQSV